MVGRENKGDGEGEEKRRERESKEKEGGQAEKRKKGVWRGVEEVSREKRGLLDHKIMRKIFDREVRLKGIDERRGEAGRWVLLTEIEDVVDKEKALEKGKVDRAWLGDRGR